MKHRFEPSQYLAANPDAKAAVAGGKEVSAWSHLLNGGFLAERDGVPNAIRKTARAVMEAPFLPPPAWLVSRMRDSTDAAELAGSGRRTALDIYAAVVPYLHMDRPQRILDFGCGCGRVLRFLSEVAPLSMIRGSDTDAEAIGWLSETYRDEVRRGRYEFTVNREVPPLRYSPNYFDLVCAVSVLAEMPGKRRHQWLAELKRVIKPEGFLILSRFGEAIWENYFEVIDPDAAGSTGLVLCRKRLPLVI